jgi:hypothetical protein
MSERWSREPARYYIMRGGRIIRRPHEDVQPLDPNSPIAKFDFAALEQSLLESYVKAKIT